MREAEFFVWLEADGTRLQTIVWAYSATQALNDFLLTRPYLRRVTHISVERWTL